MHNKRRKLYYDTQIDYFVC